MVAGAQDPPPPGALVTEVRGPGGPMAGMFEFGGLMGGFGGKVVTGKPVLAQLYDYAHGGPRRRQFDYPIRPRAFSRADADGSTYRDVKITAIGPWAASGKAQEFAYIRNVTKGTQYIVNVTKGTYQAFPIRDHNSPPREGRRTGQSRPASNDETVTDNPSGSYMDPVLTKMVYHRWMTGK